MTYVQILKSIHHPLESNISASQNTVKKTGLELLAFTTALGGFPFHPPCLLALTGSPSELSGGEGAQGSGPPFSLELGWKLKS